MVGEVIDCTKAIDAGGKNMMVMHGDLVTKKKAFAIDALPFGTVLTLAATGSGDEFWFCLLPTGKQMKNMAGEAHLLSRNFLSLVPR